jgi:LysM repeat protein
MEIVRARWYTFDQAFDRTRVRENVHPHRTAGVPMSVATTLVPDVPIPTRARPARPPERLASVSVLHPPETASLRLTSRGVLVATIALLLLTGALLWVAWLSAPQSAPRTGTPPATAAVVTVVPGDSLWSIATRVAPQRDPRAEVAELQRINHLTGAELLPGQVLRTR